MQRRRKKYVVRFTNLSLLENVVAASPRWRRHVPPALTLLALAALIVGVARPEVAEAVPRQEATVILDHGPLGLDDRDRRRSPTA